MTTTLGRARLALPLSAMLLVFALPAHAQIGGLIKKKVADAAAGKTADALSVGEPVSFDNTMLELTPDRIAKLIAGKRAGRKFAEGPDGPRSIEAKVNKLDERQAAIYSKHAEEINAADERRRDQENCLDSIYRDIHDRNQRAMQTRAQADPQFIARTRNLAIAIQTARQKGDTAAVRRLNEEFNNLSAPTKADSAAASQQCGNYTAPAIVQEWAALKEQIAALMPARRRADEAVARAEQAESGMTASQVAMACERISLYLAKLKNRSRQQGFTQQELDALKQASKDLEGLCQ